MLIAALVFQMLHSPALDSYGRAKLTSSSTVLEATGPGKLGMSGDQNSSPWGLSGDQIPACEPQALLRKPKATFRVHFGVCIPLQMVVTLGKTNNG